MIVCRFLKSELAKCEFVLFIQLQANVAQNDSVQFFRNQTVDTKPRLTDTNRLIDRNIASAVSKDFM